jgi:hypothetical protein
MHVTLTGDFRSTYIIALDASRPAGCYAARRRAPGGKPLDHDIGTSDRRHVNQRDTAQCPPVTTEVPDQAYSAE